ncbi:hypothetical protein QDR37_12445 [Amnibacterium sp. CER49]|uniref:hypothetical protein n=1 Tax=Amnibacterium sp. CER49 TaxID=3039161 RepID=UPI0024469DDA|nr:hypothetical protein [Amnibacterium sp. CER49]MDH2444756.1 hypothetical protein [Amnibacterium sp. CER49]
MSDPLSTNDDNDLAHPSQAEGEDPAAAEPEVVLEPEGRTSQAEGDDPEHPDEHEVLDPAEPD